MPKNNQTYSQVWHKTRNLSTSSSVQIIALLFTDVCDDWLSVTKEMTDSLSKHACRTLWLVLLRKPPRSSSRSAELSRDEHFSLPVEAIRGWMDGCWDKGQATVHYIRTILQLTKY